MQQVKRVLEDTLRGHNLKNYLILIYNRLISLCKSKPVVFQFQNAWLCM